MKRTGILLVVLLIGIGIGATVTMVAGGSRSEKVVENPAAAPSNDPARHDPKELRSDSSVKGSDWCVEHRVPESECTQCKPSLIAQFKARNDWCNEHNLPESHCRLCHPGLSFPQEKANGTEASLQTETHEIAADWCAEHLVPESECTQCHSDLIAAFKAKGDWCNEHQLPESHDRLCNPKLAFPQEPKSDASLTETSRPSVFFPRNKAKCTTDDAIIQFASAETAERAGIDVVPAIDVAVSVSIDAPAEIVFDETKSYAVTTTIPTTVVRWLAEPGQRLERGQPLALLESPDMPRLQADYLEAAADADVKTQEKDRADSLKQRELISAAEHQRIDGESKGAQAHLAGTLGLLKSAGLNDEDITILENGKKISSRFLLRAAVDASLLDRSAPLGGLLQPGSTIALIGDPSALWIEANVSESDLPAFKTYQPVEFAADGDALNRVTGRVIWVSQFIDQQTRTATIRAEVIGNAGELQAHSFGRLVLPVSATTTQVAVPRDAVQWEGCCNVVFVQEAIGRYRPHKVTLSRGDRGMYNVSSGLKEGDMVVVNGSYQLKTELRKGSLGAGCCDVGGKS
ncbi:MAG: efflux RND transporter periplasmic adaptor subunit [Candidatus Zixiibacteriota bacterium]